jgi:hypothetical protein
MSDEMGLRTNRDSDLDPISPELALVDPDLRRRARSELQGPATSLPQFTIDTSEPARSATRTAGAAAKIVPPQAQAANYSFEQGAEDTVLTPKRSSSRRFRWRSRVVLFALVAVIGAVGFAAAVHVSDRGADHTTVQRHAQGQGRVDTRESSPGQRQGRSRARRDKTLRASTSTSQPKQAGQKKAASKSGAARPRSTGRRSNSAGRAKKPVGALQTRVFVWPAVEGALYYKVQFFRGGDEVFEALPSAPRLGLPVRWVYKGRRLRLVPGTYSWRVLPAFGSRAHPRYGDPIVRSLWVVKK